MKALVYLLPVLVLLSCSCVFGGCLLETELATLDAVRVAPVTGSLGFKRTDALDPNEIEMAIKDRVPEILASFGITSDEKVSTHLAIFVEKSHSHATSDWIAIAVRIELREPAAIIRPVLRTSQDHFYATTWSWEIVDLVRPKEAEAQVMEWVEIGAETFAESVVSARVTSRVN